MDLPIENINRSVQFWAEVNIIETMKYTRDIPYLKHGNLCDEPTRITLEHCTPRNSLASV
jgi:hypothetical protein